MIDLYEELQSISKDLRYLTEEILLVPRDQLPAQASNLKKQLLRKNVVIVATDPDTKGNPVDAMPGPPGGFLTFGRGGVLGNQLWIDGGVNGSPNGHRPGTTMGFYWGVTKEPAKNGQRVLFLRGRSGASPEEYQSFFNNNLDLILKDLITRIPTI